MPKCIYCPACGEDMVPEYVVDYINDDIKVEGYFCDACGAEVALADDKEMLQV